MSEFNDSKPAQIDVGMRLSYLFAPLLAGCATVVIPPVNPPDPVSVYIADYGKHSSLFLPNDDGTYEEYAMGDWDFLALGRTNWWVAMRAMVRSPQATLGRRKVEVVNPQSIGANSTIPVRVSRERANSLSRELDERFRRSPVPPFFSTSSMLDHVPDPEPYWGLNNCNHLTAEWLRKLGCQLHGPAIWSNFILDPHAAR
jgi:hypothetical protein